MPARSKGEAARIATSPININRRGIATSPSHVDRRGKVTGVDAAAGATAQPLRGVAPAPIYELLVPRSSTAGGGVWGVDGALTTVFASPRFARLVGINRLVLAGVPWFVVVRPGSADALAWLVDTTAARAAAVLQLRHLDGREVLVHARRAYGGPGHVRTVLCVAPLIVPNRARARR